MTFGLVVEYSVSKVFYTLFHHCIVLNKVSESIFNRNDCFRRFKSLMFTFYATKVRPLDSKRTSLPNEQKVPGSIPSSSMGFLSNGQLLYAVHMHGVDLHIFSPLFFCIELFSANTPGTQMIKSGEIQ